MEQKNYTLKECRAFNQKQLELTTAFMKGNFKNAECKELVLPDEAHQWNILHTVIDQYYKREYEKAQIIDIARCEMERATKMFDENKECNSTYWQMHKEIDDLKHENEQLKEIISNSEKCPHKQPKALQGLLQIDTANDWADSMGNVMDSLIFTLYQSQSDNLADNLYYIRKLQKFFTELREELN